MGPGKPCLLKVVLDVNVVVSAIFYEGRIGIFRTLWADRNFNFLASKEITAEFRRVFAYPKFGYDASGSAKLFDSQILPYLVPVTGQTGPLPFPCRDPKDDIYLRAALGGKADFLISGDKDLLVLQGRYPFPIIAPAEFIRLSKPA